MFGLKGVEGGGGEKMYKLPVLVTQYGRHFGKHFVSFTHRNCGKQMNKYIIASVSSL